MSLPAFNFLAVRRMRPRNGHGHEMPSAAATRATCASVSNPRLQALDGSEPERVPVRAGRTAQQAGSRVDCASKYATSPPGQEARRLTPGSERTSMTTSFAHDSRHLAETYNRVSDSQFEGGKRLFERLGLEDGARVLDVGCGTGRLARWIAQRLGPRGSVVGIDPLAERIDIARSSGGAVRFEVGQAEDLGAFEDATFDAVCMSSVFHWISDKTKALAEVRRVLRSGGRLGVTTFPNELRSAGTIALVLQPMLQRLPYAGHVDLSVLTFARRGYTTTDLVTLVLESGMELAELHVTRRVRAHASGAALVDFLDASSFGNVFRIVPEELRPALRSELASTFDARREPEGVVTRDWGVLFVARRV